MYNSKQLNQMITRYSIQYVAVFRCFFPELTETCSLHGEDNAIKISPMFAHTHIDAFSLPCSKEYRSTGVPPNNVKEQSMS